MTMNEMQALLTDLMRGIDKKTVLTLAPSQDTNRSGVTVRLSQGRRTGSLELTEADVVAGKTDLMRRDRLRVALKRASDRMFETTGYIFSTKMERPKADANHWSRPSQGRGRR